MSSLIPVPHEDDDSINERRLWIGNLDLRITEFVMLKLIQRFGKPERFDFIYHLTGPEKGRPRGYCFVTFTTKEIAEKAIKGLDGKLALSRRLCVRWATDKYQTDLAPGSSSFGTSGSFRAPDKADESNVSTENKIRAIEAKLSAMEQTQKDFGLSELPAAPPGTSRYSSINAPPKNTGHNSRGSSYSRRRPYVPNHNRGRRR